MYQSLSCEARRVRVTQRGTSLIEVMLASAVTLVSVVSYLATIVKVDDLRRSSENMSRALEGARLKLAELQLTPFDELVRRYDAVEENDPGGPGTASGPTFAVAGLARLDGPATPVGEVVLPLDGAGALREDLALPELGLPRDVNGDGVIDSIDHSNDGVLMPVLVRVRWDSKGPQSVELKTLLGDRR